MVHRRLADETENALVRRARVRRSGPSEHNQRPLAIVAMSHRPLTNRTAALALQADQLAENDCGMVQIRQAGGQRRLG